MLLALFRASGPDFMYHFKFSSFFLALAALLALTAFGLFIHRTSSIRESQHQDRSESSSAKRESTPQRPAGPSSASTERSSAIVDKATPALPVIPNDDQPVPLIVPRDDQVMPPANPSVVAKVDPTQLVTDVGKTLEAADYDGLVHMLGKDVCDPKTIELLKTLASKHPFKIKPGNGIREIGELELNTLSRWSLNFEGAEPGYEHIFLDLRNTNGKWSVAKLTLPPLPEQTLPTSFATDSLAIADAFIQAVLHQNFELARALVDPQTLSETKIAALCILFEEGKYQLRPTKTLRALFHRGDTVAYLANLLTPDASQTAQFALTLRQTSSPANWIITEINLDQLLADYASRVAGGDVYYSPLVKNPHGGDTLALYFEFDEDQINPRTRRQLEIVTHILRADPTKKITLSGHTDALGTIHYNNQLSARRAATVRDFLASAGVSPNQIVTFAKGASQPRRPNVTAAGHDDPVGRRANRRTEIYLDF